MTDTDHHEQYTILVSSLPDMWNALLYHHLCYVYTMFPAATAAPFDQNVVHRGILALFQLLLGLATFSNGLSRYAGWAVTGRRWSTPGGSKARYGSARSASDLLRMPLRCLAGRHGLMGFLTSFTFSQDSLRMKRGHRTALKRVWTYLASYQFKKKLVANATSKRSRNLLKLFSTAKLQ